MDYETFVRALADAVGTQLPTVISALAVLVIGWLLAIVVRSAVRRVLSWIQLNHSIASSAGAKLPAEEFVAGLSFATVILVTLVAVFNVLNLQQVSGTIGTVASQILGYLPKLLAGTILSLVAWVVAVLLRSLTEKVLAATDLDQKLAQTADLQPVSRTAAQILFWLVILLFVPMILSAFELSGLLQPLTHMIDRLLGVLPNLFAAAVIGFVGYLVARVLRGLVVGLVTASRLDERAHAAGLRDGIAVSQLIGTLIFMFVFVPSLIAALDALQIEAISRPATELLSRLLAEVPNLIAATLIIFISYYVGRFACGLLANLLASLGVDSIPAKLGLSERAEGWQVSRFAGQLAHLTIMLLAVAEASDQLGFDQVRDLVTLFLNFGADIVMGGLILAIGFWVSNRVHEAVHRASGTATMAAIARWAVIGLVVAMGLRAMGVADDIVNLAFGLAMGSVSVAVALAFGLGGREAAGRHMEYWLSQWRAADQARGQRELKRQDQAAAGQEET